MTYPCVTTKRTAEGYVCTIAAETPEHLARIAGRHR